jgi:RNA polymerase sigma-70 factor (ECF subfamily)
MQSSGVNVCFEQLMTRHHREIYVYISRLTQGSPETADLFQETFLRAYRSHGRLPEDANRRAWLFKIATNLCRNYFRRLQRHREVGLQEAYPTVERSASNGSGLAHDDPAQHFLTSDLERRALMCIDALPLKQRAALIQRKLLGLSYDSIAASLQCSPEAARAHVFQALKKIRTVLEIPSPKSNTPRQLDKNSILMR